MHKMKNGAARKSSLINFLGSYWPICLKENFVMKWKMFAACMVNSDMQHYRYLGTELERQAEHSTGQNEGRLHQRQAWSEKASLDQQLAGTFKIRKGHAWLLICNHCRALFTDCKSRIFQMPHMRH